MMRLNRTLLLAATGLSALANTSVTPDALAQTATPQQYAQQNQYGQQQRPATQQMTREQYAAQQQQLATQQRAVTEQQNAQRRVAAQQAAGNRQAGAAQQPFAPLTQAEQAQLDQVLLAWEKQSQATKTLQCKFDRWHFDLHAAPAGVHASKATGEIKYANPDRGLFKVETLVHYNGMQANKPQYIQKPGLLGEHWVCNGRELIDFDHGKKKCTIRELPPNMQGAEIFNSPLPFVFNLNAQQIKQRYWVRQGQPPKPGMILIEAWPKQAQDRSQYRLVQIALSEGTFLPQALLMYAPNFNAKTAPNWDHYEFKDVSRNGVGQRLNVFMKAFIPAAPPSNWQVTKEKFQAPASPQAQSAPQAQNAPQQQRAQQTQGTRIQ